MSKIWQWLLMKLVWTASGVQMWSLKTWLKCCGSGCSTEKAKKSDRKTAQAKRKPSPRNRKTKSRGRPRV